jgi:valyl-tRNA synthetase
VCDWYLEITKAQLTKPSAVSSQPSATTAILGQVLETSLRLLHPIMPFVTEELWQQLQPSAVSRQRSAKTRSIIVAKWPKADKRLIDNEAERLLEQLKAVVTAIRTTRAELNVPLTGRPAVHLATSQPAVRAFFESHRTLLQALAQTGEVSVAASRQQLKQAAATVVDGIEVLIPLAGLIDPAQERQRLQQRIEELTKHLGQLEARLRDAQFSAKAPKDVLEQTKARRDQVRETLKKFSDHLAAIQSM